MIFFLFSRFFPFGEQVGALKDGYNKNMLEHENRQSVQADPRGSVWACQVEAPWLCSLKSKYRHKAVFSI